MKWCLSSLLLLTLLALSTLILQTNSAVTIFGGGGCANYFKYSQTIIIQQSTTKLVTETQTGSIYKTFRG